MNKAKVLSLALTLALVGCSSGPYSEITKGDYVVVYYVSGGTASGKVLKKNSDGITVGNLLGTVIIPWSSVKSVKVE
jgi:hypothetical protein